MYLILRVLPKGWEHMHDILCVGHELFTFLRSQKNIPNDLCSVLPCAVWQQRVKKHIAEFSRAFGFCSFDLCSENLLSQMPFHTTCLIYLVQLIAVENVYSRGQVFVARSQQECGRAAGEARKGSDTLALGAGVWRAGSFADLKQTDRLENLLWKSLALIVSCFHCRAQRTSHSGWKNS